MTMDRAFLAAYSLRLIATCHRRGAFAMGGMSAFIPVKGDVAANVQALDKVRADKLRERELATTAPGSPTRRWCPWRWKPSPRWKAPTNCIRNHERIPAREAMLELHTGPRTEAGAREIRVAVQYIAAWLAGRGAVPLYNLMEDAATAEICRAQLWQWLRFEAPFDDGRRFSSICSRIGWPTSSPRSATYPTSSPPPACSTSWSRPTSSRSS